MVRFAVVALMFGLAADVLACTGRNWNANDLVENVPVYSANARFCVVVRWYDGVADFTAERAGKVMGFDNPMAMETADDVRPPRKSVIAALYESAAKGRRLIGEIPIEIESFGEVLVADSGRYVIAVRRLGTGGCGGHALESDPFLTIYTSEGTRAGALRVGDVFN